MSGLPWIPKFRFPAATGTVLTLTLPQKEWAFRNPTTGGFKDSAVGIRAARTIRRDHLLDIFLRVDSSERAAVEALVEYMQDNPATACTFWPDKDVAGTSFSVLLISPGVGEDLEFTNSELPGIKELKLTLRKSDNSAWTLDFYA